MSFRNWISFAGFSIGLIVMLVTSNQRDVLGEFQAVVNDAGYVEFDTTAILYKGILEMPKSVEGIRIERRSPSRIIYEDYINHKTGAFRTDAILGKMVELADVETSHFEVYCRDRIDDCADDASDVFARWQNRSSHLAYRAAYDRLKEALDLAHSFNAGGSRSALGLDMDAINEHTPEMIAFRQALMEGLEIFESLMLDQAGVTERTNKFSSIWNLIKYNGRRHHIKSDRTPAANLLVPDSLRFQYGNQSFFSPQQLAAYGGDISRFDPPSSGFWRKPHWSIPEFGTANYNDLGLYSLVHSLDSTQIQTILDKSRPPKVIYEEDDLSGRTPKVTVKIGDQDWKMKYVTHMRDRGFTINPSKAYQKKWLGSEVNVEPVVNNLAAAIGYTVDPTYYQEKVHLYFEDEESAGTQEEADARFEQSLRSMISDLKVSYSEANIESAFEHVQRDEVGRLYVEIREATLEKKSDPSSDVNIGYYMRAGFGKSFKREFRAFSVFLAWVADPDIKDGNVKAKLVPIRKPDGRSTYRLVYSASDMGGALGTGFPNLFKKDFTKNISADDTGRFESMRLTYRSIFPAPLLEVVSFDDFRWIARMIGQLTREQIYASFEYAGYPDVVAQYYTEILLRRRDQLVEAAGLMGEKVVDPFGRETTFEPLSKMTDPKNFTIEGYETFFKKGELRDKDNDLFDPEKGFFPRYWGTSYPWN